MRVEVINTSTTAGITVKIGAAARAAVSHGMESVAVTLAAGPVSIESHNDEAVSVLGVLEEVRKGEAKDCNGYVTACFGNLGLLGARKIAIAPVVEIARHWHERHPPSAQETPDA